MLSSWLDCSFTFRGQTRNFLRDMWLRNFPHRFLTSGMFRSFIAWIHLAEVNLCRFCTIVIQVVILYFTLLKYLRGNWKTVPIVKLMFRDGTLSFTILTSASPKHRLSTAFLISCSVFSMSMSVLTVIDNPYAVPGYA